MTRIFVYSPVQLQKMEQGDYMNQNWRFLIAGFAAGAVNGLFGAGGGMVLVPLLTAMSDLEEDHIFPASICIILPICLVSLFVTALRSGLNISGALPYLFGSALGGLAAGYFGKRIPVTWLHRVLGALILWGGVRNLY